MTTSDKQPPFKSLTTILYEHTHASDTPQAYTRARTSVSKLDVVAAATSKWPGKQKSKRDGRGHQSQ